MDESGLRACMGRFATGVTVVSYQIDGRPRGITVNAFASISLEPPLVLASISRQARSHDLLHRQPFCVNVLSLDQEPVARYFAGDPDWEPEVRWERGELAPRLVGVLAWMECRPWDRHEAGDHTLYLGEVVAYDHSEGEALGFFTSRFVPISRPMPSQMPLPDYPFELDFDT
jgi:flavin reductase (DIM6/NTAB) family NADH-FMN oxidoreductase RutF